MRYELDDYKWTGIKPKLPNNPRGVRWINDRRALNGIFWVLCSGAPWRDLPETHGPRTTCHDRFVRWRRAGAGHFSSSAAARAASGYWNNSGFSISHQFYRGLHSSYSNYSPTNISGNRYYFGGLRPRPHGDGASAPTEDTPVPVDWAKKCGSSCPDL